MARQASTDALTGERLSGEQGPPWRRGKEQLCACKEEKIEREIYFHVCQRRAGGGEQRYFYTCSELAASHLQSSFLDWRKVGTHLHCRAGHVGTCFSSTE